MSNIFSQTNSLFEPYICAISSGMDIHYRYGLGVQDLVFDNSCMKGMEVIVSDLWYLTRVLGKMKIHACSSLCSNSDQRQLFGSLANGQLGIPSLRLQTHTTV